MLSNEEFHKLVGETIMYCQCIEHDVKLIFAGMKAGDFQANLREIKRANLGDTLKELELLDKSDNKPYFADSDYRLLDKIRIVRNYLAHESYREFLYLLGEEQDRAYERVCEKLQKEKQQLEDLYKSVEQVRMNVLKNYRRI
jgi:hypothetical protein